MWPEFGVIGKRH